VLIEAILSTIAAGAPVAPDPGEVWRDRRPAGGPRAQAAPHRAANTGSPAGDQGIEF